MIVWSRIGDYSDALPGAHRRILAGEPRGDDEPLQVHVRKPSGIVKVFPSGVLRPRNRI